MCGFEENVRKPDFLAKNGQKWQKLTIFGQNLENENFFQKSAWNIFLVSPRCNFGQSFRKVWCADLQISRRVAHGRTDERTDERESIGPSANAERPINIRENYKSILHIDVWSLINSSPKFLSIRGQLINRKSIKSKNINDTNKTQQKKRPARIQHTITCLINT